MGNLLARIGGMLAEPPIDADDVGLGLAYAIWDITWPILTVLAGLGTIFAIWLGMRLATAQDESKRKEAKAQLIYALIAIVVIIGLIAVFGVTISLIGDDPRT